MYTLPFYITEPVGNNAFSFEKRTNKKLFVPSLKKATKLSEIELGNEIVFEDIDENNALQSCTGLKNFYQFTLHIEGKKIPLYLFDNHNHALYFWYQALYDGVLSLSPFGTRGIPLSAEERVLWSRGLGGGYNVLHIDEHADTRVPRSLLSPLRRGDVGKTEGLKTIFNYTNFVTNVGNYMIPAQKEGLVGDIIQIRDETSLEQDYDAEILNLDLDFFSPRLDYIPYEKKKDFIVKHIKKAKIITVCTSPFFIDQTLALDKFRDILSEFIPN